MTKEQFNGAAVYQVQLGPIGRPDSTGLNKAIKSYIPYIVKTIEDGRIVPNEYELFGNGFEVLADAWKYQASGKGGSNKVIVKLQDP
jgi:hypothetical protein